MCAFVLAVPAMSQSIFINEFVASNGDTIADEDGEYSDWLELYNADQNAVNLEGWGISDSLSTPFKWVFSNVIMEPGEYLLVWASGKDRSYSSPPGQTILVESGAEWLYLDNGSDQGTGWRSPGFDDSTWASGPAPLGYGTQEDYVATTISYGGDGDNKYITTYFRKHFEVDDVEGFESLLLSLWLDDGAVVYLNGVELIRELMPTGDINYSTTSSSYVGQWPEWTHYQLPVDALQQGSNVLVVEVHQVSVTSSDLAFDLRLLGDVPARNLHTNFSISAAGEPLTLTRPDETLEDEVASTSVPCDIAYGRVEDGEETWGFTMEPTPGASNNNSTWYSEVLEEPQFSHQGGFYTAPFQLTLESDDPNVTIYYTLDGSEPDPNNLTAKSYTYKNWYPVGTSQTPSSTFLSREMQTHIYSAAIGIADRSPEDYQVSTINVEFSNSTRLPLSNIFKGTVVRARAFKQGTIPSRSATSTYFVNPDIMTRYALPVISIATDEDGFFDYYKGIYVAGKIGDDWRLANPGVEWNAGMPANYHERGDEWERSVHFELFDTDGTPLLSQNIGARIHGGWSRGWYPKSLRMYARSEYDDENTFEYPIFEGLEKHCEPGTPLTTFRRLILRDAGNDFYSTYFRDALMQELAGNLSIDTMAYRPAVHFVNGEYWGMINIRERFDQYYLESHYNVNPDDVAILTGSYPSVDTGFPSDRDHFIAAVTYSLNNDPAQDVNYDWICRYVDPENLAYYYALEVYWDNYDWPHNNIDFWRKRTADYEPNAPYGHDGRWRWMLYDTDFGMNLYGSTNHTKDSLGRVMNESLGQTNTLFNRMRLNTRFRNTFVNAMADLMNTSFKPAHINALIDTYNARLQSSRSEHNNRWRTSIGSGAEMKTFATQRPGYMRGFILGDFGLSGTHNLTVSRNEDWGHVRVNKITINSQTPGVNPAAVYPWTGEYYQGVPVTVTAVAEPGYQFSHWDGPAGIDPEAETLTLSLTEAVSLTANFEETPAPTLIHYWHFNNLPSGTLTTVSADYSVNPGAQITYPGSGDGYMDRVDDGTTLNARMLEPVGYALRVRNPSDTRQLLLELATTGYQDVVFSYAVNRTTYGAQTETLEYRTDALGDWQSFDEISISEDYALFTFDFSDISAAADNPDFAVRILFGGDNASGTSGNNRFDNIVLEGFPLQGTNLPPQLLGPIPFTETIEDSPTQLDLSSHFTDPDEDALTFTAQADKPFVVQTSVTGDTLTLTPLYRGDAVITVSADDGRNPPVETTFRVLVYPTAHPLRMGMFSFGEWSPEYPECTFPDGILFLQSDVTDPELGQAMEYAYFIPHDDYHADDQDKIGYPYMTTGRTRLNGLDEDGIAFINTGRGRDLGGALTAVDTTGIDGVDISWLAGTILENYRRYAIRLQYRVGIDGPFIDVLDNGQPVEYVVQTDGDTQDFGPIELPAEAIDQPYVQLLWRYYYIDVTSGARAQLRLDNITVLGVPDMFERFSLFAQWWLTADCELYDNCDGADMSQNGTVDFEDFAIFADQWFR